MPNQPTDPRALFEASGVTEAEADAQRIQRDVEAEQARLKALTRQQLSRLQRGPAASRSGDLETLLDEQAIDDRLQRDIAESTAEIPGLFRALRAARDLVAERRAQFDAQVRPLLTQAKQESLGTVADLTIALADALIADRRLNLEADQLTGSAGLRPLNFENVLGGIHARINVSDGQAPFFDELVKEWAERGWLAGPSAERALARARSNFQQIERAAQQRQQREAEGQRRATEQRLQTQRALLASGELTMSAGGGRPGNLSPVEAVARFDRVHGSAPRLQPAPSRSGELVSI